MWQFDFKEVMCFINSQQEYLTTCERLFRIYNREIIPFLKERINRDFASENSRNEVISRLSPVNILPKVVNKLSNVYAVSADRNVVLLQNDKLSELMTALKFDSAMRLANKYLNLFRVVAVEPIAGFDKEGQQVANSVSGLRVYPAHKFLLMDDGTIDGNVVCFIKIIGNARKTDLDRYGKQCTRDVVVYEAYTATEYVRFDSEGIMTKTDEIGNEVPDITSHSFGRIPVAWMTRDTVTTMPPADVDTYEMATLLPLMLSDANYAMKYKCFSVIYAIGLSMSAGAFQPNSILKFENDSKIPGETGELGQLAPQILVSEMLDMIYAQYSLWLESRGIKINSLARGGVDSSAVSGIAKAIDQGEVTEDLIYQRGLFADFEGDLFSLLAQFQGQNYSVSTNFPEVSVMPETNTEKTERIIRKLEAGLIDWDSAVEQTNSEKNPKQIEEIKAKIKAEKANKERENGMGNSERSDQTRQEPAK